MSSIFKRFRKFIPIRSGGDFIEQIEKGDIRYIIEVGVPDEEITELPKIVSWKAPFIAQGLELGSILLMDPQTLLYVLRSSEAIDFVRLSGDGGFILSQIARMSIGYGGPIYVHGTFEKGELKAISYGGYVTGIVLREHGGETLTAAKAYNTIASMKIDTLRLHVFRLKTTLIDWKDSVYTVYIRGLDRQHRYYAETVNYIYHAIIGGQPMRVVEVVLDRLAKFARFHFRSEELLMDRYGYPSDKLERHVREHNAFVTTITEFHDRFERRDKMLIIDMLKYLTSWFRNHIAGVDKDYAQFFRKAGIANVNI